MRSSIGVVMILCSLMAIQFGCAPDAPHDNPLDPGSPNYRNAGNLSGKVLTLSIPNTGIPNALVTIQQNGSAQLTASDGSFSFADAPSGSLSVVVSKPSYMSDTLNFTLPVGGRYDATFHLDALPVITNPQVVTTKIDQWWPGPVYYATVTANVTDPDGIGDIVDSTVSVQVDSLSFVMNYSGGTGTFQATINATQLPGQDLQWLVGKEFFVHARDRENGSAIQGPFYVSRIIESEPATTYPANSDTTSANPTFEWSPPPVSFNYTYSLQVFLVNAGTPSQVGNPIILGANFISYSYPDSLAPGQYFWTIGITDSYGNSSRSKEASFIVP